MAKHGGIKDNGTYFVIDPLARKVIVPHTQKSISVVGDHNSEQITFECSQIIDGHDISKCEKRYVSWINVNGVVGHDGLQIAQVEQSAEGKVYLTWTIRDGLTVAKGVVQFSIHFEDTDDNGKILYRWGTTICKDCEILDSINAVLGAYESIYVVDNRLVFEDYNPVKDGTLKLETNGLIPEGTLIINHNGTFDVGKYAQVAVEINEGFDYVDLFPVTFHYTHIFEGLDITVNIEYIGCENKSDGVKLRTFKLSQNNNVKTLYIVANSKITVTDEVVTRPLLQDGYSAVCMTMPDLENSTDGIIESTNSTTDYKVLKGGDLTFAESYIEIPNPFA